MNRTTLTLSLALTLGLSTQAIAGPTCNSPKEQWQNEGQFKAKLEQQGYQIKQFKVTRQNCYEIYGHDKTGQRVEIYFDPASGAVVASK